MDLKIAFSVFYSCLLNIPGGKEIIYFLFVWTINIKKMSFIHIKGKCLKQVCGAHSESLMIFFHRLLDLYF